MGPDDLLQLRLPHGLTVLLWPGMATGQAASGEGTWSRSVDVGEVMLELGRLTPQTGDAAHGPVANTTSISIGGDHLTAAGKGSGFSGVTRDGCATRSRAGADLWPGAAVHPPGRVQPTVLRLPPGSIFLDLHRVHLPQPSPLRSAPCLLPTDTGGAGMPRSSAIGLSWWPARQEDEAHGSNATMAALGATMAASMLLLVLGSFCSCLFRCNPGAGGVRDAPTGLPPNRVPTSLRLQLKPTPYGRLGAAGDYFKRKAAALPSVQLARRPPAASVLDATHDSAAATGPSRPVAGASALAALQEPQQAKAAAQTSADADAHAPAALTAMPADGGSVPAGVNPLPGTSEATGVVPACCAICLIDFEPNSAALVLPCGHGGLNGSEGVGRGIGGWGLGLGSGRRGP
jgi:hypothetical protein